MPNEPLKPLTTSLAEAAVDDALAAAEKHPEMKRSKLNKEAARRFLDEDENDQDD